MMHISVWGWIDKNIVFERNEQDWNKNHSFSFRFFINFAGENK